MLSENRVSGERHSFSGSGQQTVTVDSDEFINLVQADITVNSDTNIEFKIGTAVIFTGNIIANATPVQLFFYDFGRGRGTGEKGDDLTITLGGAGEVFITYITVKG